MTSPYEIKQNDSVSDDVVWHNSTVTRKDRLALKQQKPVVLWFTGLSGSGKSTVANAVESKLLSLGKHSYLLDGDNVRHGLNKDLALAMKTALRIFAALVKSRSYLSTLAALY
ncbi:adenylylsulfate kinase [Vibrio astriarenae]|nr:adenylylsulfate kinase [Vibrio sp. C7]